MHKRKVAAYINVQCQGVKAGKLKELDDLDPKEASITLDDDLNKRHTPPISAFCWPLRAQFGRVQHPASGILIRQIPASLASIGSVIKASIKTIEGERVVGYF